MIRVSNISKKFKTFSLENISFDLDDYEYLVVLGKSGAGKSLVLEAIAGLLKLDAGMVEVNGLDITKYSIQKRNIGLVFQDYSLFPHMNVYENIVFALRSRNNKILKSDKDRIIDLSETLGIKSLLQHSVPSLSIGEKQRVALARCLVSKPDILLLDEPLSSLDFDIKKDIKALLHKIASSDSEYKPKNIIHVTHDLGEAIELADKILYIENGAVMQFGNALNVMNNPKSKFLKSLIEENISQSEKIRKALL